MGGGEVIDATVAVLIRGVDGGGKRSQLAAAGWWWAW